MNPAGFFTIPDAAHHARRPERTIRTWIRRGVLHSEIRGGQIHVYLPDVIELHLERVRRLHKSHSCD